VRCIAVGLLIYPFLATATTSAHDINWVDSWAAAPDTVGPPLNARTMREVIRTSIGGSELRLRLSNLLGSGPITIGPVMVAKHAEASAIKSGTGHKVRSEARRQ
jgi:hypothetical protein